MSGNAPGRLLEERPGLAPLPPTLDLSGFDLCANRGALSTNLGTFARAGGPAGSGESVCGDTNTVQVKDGSLPNLFGRFNPFPVAQRWIDSNDLTDVEWVIDTTLLGIAPLSGLEFAVIDAHDQLLSWFHVEVDGARLFTSEGDLERRANGNVIWMTLLFDDPVERTTITFRTRHNDGFGIANFFLAPIPLPPAVLLLGAGMLLLVGVGRRRTAA